ncbi:adenosylcobinamide amidohydrolase [Pelagicoccus sp. SDUM812002]|uniref:adenosylcobinamide amidohydrolase n=1 Tax=Pelagicoccus sp. SDUM812002 TaxID=3041266 RepID=UPI00280F3040|nr:adenosylcobinamide amidohydrolase [Pelagicoccus sp. SDUM812002]MDQ8187531.1 adenosylcobinamide amidohydrolase [Pelagicoccus sp. SDUM812002]
MKIGEYYDAVNVFRAEKIVYALFLKPHRVLSTCRLNGGLREDLDYLYNHQSCEPRAHTGTDLCQVAVKEPERYQKRIASKAGIDFAKSASLGTAANVNNAAFAVEKYMGLEVVAITTAGVGGNGGRAGDPASYYASEQGTVIFDRPPPQAGTINTMLLINQELSNGALVAASTMMTEAKSSVLQELMAPSRYSEGIATGTGTDQIGIACLMGTSIQHTDANKHSKLGELIGLAVRRSLFDALNLQSGLTPDSRRSSVAQLQRFGETQDSFIRSIKEQLEADARALFEANFLSANHDPVTVAAVQALVHVRDQFVWGVSPLTCIHEIMISHAALIASAVGGREIGREEMQERLRDYVTSLESASLLELIHRSFAIGYTMKWSGRFED